MVQIFQKAPFWNLRPESPPHFGKLQIWDDQSLLRNTPPISENFRFGMTKVYSGIPPPPISENFRFGMTKVYSGIPPPISENFRFGMTKVYSGIPHPPRQFKNAESYYMWRLYPTGITTRLLLYLSFSLCHRLSVCGIYTGSLSLLFSISMYIGFCSVTTSTWL